MATPSIPVSLRLSPADAEWLSAREFPGAASPGEKLRALLREARARSEEGEPAGYAGWLARFSAAADPFIQALRRAEFAQGLHSEVLARFGTWLPETLAYCLAEAPDPEAGPEALARFEAGVAERLAVVAQQLLQLAVAGRAPTYDAALPEAVAGPVVELADAVRGRKGKKKKK